MQHRSRYGAALIGLLGAAVTLWGIPLAGQAQTAPVVTRTQGTLVSADCSGLTLNVRTPAGVQGFKVTNGTGVTVGDEGGQSFCALSQFVGAQVIVVSGMVDGNQVAGQVDVLAFPAQGTIGSLGPDAGNDARGGDASNNSGSGSGGNNGGGNKGGGNNGGGSNGGGGGKGGGSSGGGNNGGGDKGGGNNGGGNNGGGDKGGGNNGGGNNGGGGNGGGKNGGGEHSGGQQGDGDNG